MLVVVKEGSECDEPPDPSELTSCHGLVDPAPAACQTMLPSVRTCIKQSGPSNICEIHIHAQTTRTQQCTKHWQVEYKVKYRHYT